MPDQFLHGIETVQIDDGIRPIRTARSSVIGIVGTAPEADEAAFPYDKPILITETENGDLKPGSDAPLKLKMDVRYYRLEINGEEIFEIDLVNAKRVIGGVDQLASARAAMGF